MRLFRRKKNRKKFCLKSSRSFKPVIFEDLEQRILLSGNDLSGITDNLSHFGTTDNNLQIIEKSILEDSNTNDIITTYHEFVSGAVIEQTEIVVYQSSLLEYNTLELNSQGLQFNLNPASGMSQQAIDAFHAAADLLTALFTDDIIVNIDINFTNLAGGMLGTSSFTMQLNTYSELRNALINDKKSGNDNIAVNNLPSDSNLDVYINRTSNNPNGSGSSVPYVDNDSDSNNNRIRLTTANAKALGLLAAGNTATNASITFSNLFTWDFDRSNGITSGAFDFVGVALHEICHALGFTSGVDVLDESPGLADNTYTYINPLDLYRFSNDSISAGADIDWTADARSKFFSIDGGVSSLATFATGHNFGDGYECSHWKDNMNFGIMDPTSYSGEFMDITIFDTTAFDVIGWDVSAVSVKQLPYSQDFGAGLPGGTEGWEYYSNSEGRIQVINGRLRMDDFGSNEVYSLNEAILHVDLTDKSGITLSLDHYRLADESTALPSQFSGHYNGDGISLSVDGVNWVTITSLSWSNFTNKSFVLDTIIAQAKSISDSTNLSDVRIKFQQYDNGVSPNDGREFDNIQIVAVSSVAVQQLQYSQDFGTGLPGGSEGWEYYSNSEGRIQVINGRLRMDDFGSNEVYSLNEAILHVDLTDKSGITLSLDHYRLADESTALPSQFSGHYNGDGISLSVDGINWVTITSLSWSNFTNKSFVLDAIIAQAKSISGSTNLSDVRIKFQQYDNGVAPNDGREFDNIQVTSSAAVIVQIMPYLQDFGSGLPLTSQGWEYYSNSEGRIQVINGRLRMDDFGSNEVYSLNEAILHVDLTDKTGITLSLDHWRLADESTALPSQFSGHYNGDGISLSVDGINWVTITSLSGNFTNKSFVLDTIIAQAKSISGSTNVSDVRIKFQQYDNGVASNDGREFDNIQIV